MSTIHVYFLYIHLSLNHSSCTTKPLFLYNKTTFPPHCKWLFSSVVQNAAMGRKRGLRTHRHKSYEYYYMAQHAHRSTRSASHIAQHVYRSMRRRVLIARVQATCPMATWLQRQCTALWSGMYFLGQHVIPRAEGRVILRAEGWYIAFVA